MTAPRKIRWLIAHFPFHLFQRTAEAFNQELEKALPGKFELEVHTFKSYVEKYGKFDEFLYTKKEIPGLETVPGYTEKNSVNGKELTKKWNKLFEGLANGDIEMTQTQVHIVGTNLDKNFEALDLPFLFENHNHVSKVLDGKIGDNLSENLSAKTDIRSLAFTYSGGNRIIGSNTDITNLTELIDTNFFAGSFVGQQMFKDLGIKSVKYAIGNEGSGDSVNNTMALETTYIRFTGKNVLKTNHSVFMTTILTGNKFFNSLSTEEQAIFKRIAKTVAKLERQWSIEDAEQYERNAIANGVKIVELSNEEQSKLRKVAKNSYRYIKNLNVDPTLVKNIIAEGKK
jgi:TRAP-type C4-dicarboxylate transport system substrate-binding protein